MAGTKRLGLWHGPGGRDSDHLGFWAGLRRRCSNLNVGLTSAVPLCSYHDRAAVLAPGQPTARAAGGGRREPLLDSESLRVGFPSRSESVLPSRAHARSPLPVPRHIQGWQGPATRDPERPGPPGPAQTFCQIPGPARTFVRIGIFFNFFYCCNISSYIH